MLYRPLSRVLGLLELRHEHINPVSGKLPVPVSTYNSKEWTAASASRCHVTHAGTLKKVQTPELIPRDPDGNMDVGSDSVSAQIVSEIICFSLTLSPLPRRDMASKYPSP